MKPRGRNRISNLLYAKISVNQLKPKLNGVSKNSLHFTLRPVELCWLFLLIACRLPLNFAEIRRLWNRHPFPACPWHLQSHLREAQPNLESSPSVEAHKLFGLQLTFSRTVEGFFFWRGGVCRCDAASAHRLWLVPDEWFSRVKAGKAALVKQQQQQPWLKMFLCEPPLCSISLSLIAVAEMKQTCYVSGKIIDSRPATSCACADEAPVVLACCTVTFEISVPCVSVTGQ